MPSGRGPTTPVGIGVTSASGVNVVVVVELRLGVFSKEQALYIVHVSSLKAPLFKKIFLSFSALGNVLGSFGGKVGNSWALGRASGGSDGCLKSESGG